MVFIFPKKMKVVLYIRPSAQGNQSLDSDEGTRGCFLEVLLFMVSTAKGMVYGDR